MRRSFTLLATLCVAVSLFHLTTFSANGLGSDFADVAGRSPEADGRTAPGLVDLPGPLPPFLRMAAIGESALPEEVLPLLARNVARAGFRKQSKGSRPTEFLLLLKDYLKQAYELQALAGPDGRIQVPDCAAATSLLAVIGYRFRQACGPNAVLGAEDPKRAFITMDSGFPLLQLETSLREGKTFTYDFNASKLPVLLTPGNWSVNGKDVISSLMDDPELSRLYSALADLDKETCEILRQSIGWPKLQTWAAMLDFYGSHIQIRAGRVLVPGGTAAEPAWKNLVGVSPDSPAAFITRLLEKDGGWMAALFDILARAPRSQQRYFTDVQRLARFYSALKGRTAAPGPAQSSFRPAPGLLILISRLEFGADGQPRIPGGLETWKEILRRHRENRVSRDWARRAAGMNRPEQLLEALIAFSRYSYSNPALQAFLVLNEIDRRRPSQQRLSPRTVARLESRFSRFGSLYSFFTEWSTLDEESITQFLDRAEGLDTITNPDVRVDAIGMYQSLLGLWQIFARQGQIAGETLNPSWQDAIRPFAGIKSSAALFDAARASLTALNRAANGGSTLAQDEIVALLAGPNQDGEVGQQMRGFMAARMRAVMESQRLIPLDILFDLADGLAQISAGKNISKEALIRHARDLKGFEAPKPIFSKSEKTMWSPLTEYNPHATQQSRTDLVRILTATKVSQREAADALGSLTPLLRDTLVGLNYAYYEPPGSYVLHGDPMLVRSHDFAGSMTMAPGNAWQPSQVSDRGMTAGGGTHLEGSLADLPYALAQIEKDFMIPESIQALVWEDVAPDLLAGATLPRWWHVTPNELHAVTLYQKLGEDVLAASAAEAAVRQQALEILSDRLTPQRLEQLDNLLATDQAQQARARLTPAEILHLAAEFRERHPGTETGGAADKELEMLLRQFPNEVNWEKISTDFGTPHPAIARTYSRELFGLALLPTFMGYSSRLLAESWESNNLYWARLADEKGYHPVMLHELVPALTRRMVEKISGTDLEDWPALLRALHETGEEFRSGKIIASPGAGIASTAR
jgi:hypothetical protein